MSPPSTQHSSQERENQFFGQSGKCPDDFRRKHPNEETAASISSPLTPSSLMSAPVPIPSSTQREYWDETDDEYDESADEEIADEDDEGSEQLQVADLLDFLDSLPPTPVRSAPLHDDLSVMPLPLPSPVSPSLSPGRSTREGPLPPQSPQPRELDRSLPSAITPLPSPSPLQQEQTQSPLWENYEPSCTSEHSGEADSTPRPPGPTPVDVNWRYSRCSICYEDITEPCILECGHFFCFTCLETFLRLSMNSGSQSSLACPELSCGRNLSDFDIRCILPSDEYYRFQYLKKAKYKKRGENEVWCPRLDCSGCAPIKFGERWLTCGTCSHLFCMQCRGPSHPGMKCKKARKKIKKQKKKEGRTAATLSSHTGEGVDQHLLLKEDRHTKRWASRHTKACPKCGEIIQKNGGCHHVECTTCGHEFCWRCMAPAANGPLHCKGKKVVAIVATVVLSPVLVVGGVVAGGAYLIESRVIRPNEDRENCITYKPLQDLSERASLQLYWLVD